jgi:hypothetical protein
MVKEVQLEIMTDLHILGPLNMKKYFPVCHLFVCIYVCMCASLGPEWLDGFCSHTVFKSISVLGWCPVNIKILAQKLQALWMHPKIQNHSNNLD